MKSKSQTYLEYLYEDKGRRCFADCEMDEKMGLVGHLINEATDLTEASEALCEGKRGDELPFDFAYYLIQQDKDSAEDFLKKATLNAVNMYEERIDERFDLLGEVMCAAERESIAYSKSYNHLQHLLAA